MTNKVQRFMFFSLFSDFFVIQCGHTSVNGVEMLFLMDFGKLLRTFTDTTRNELISQEWL